MKNSQQADTPHRIALCRNNSTLVAQADLHTAAADIDKESDLAVQMHAVFDGQVNEPGFLFRPDHGDWNAVPFRDQCHKRFAVLRLSQCACGDCLESRYGKPVE